jgi:monoterpene epsilon-lactone hydrolase
MSLENPYANYAEPDPKDIDAWVAHLQPLAQMVTAMLKARFADQSSATLREHSLRQSTLYEIAPPTVAVGDQDKAILYVHGGAFTSGGGIAAAYAAYSLVDLAGLKVFSIDYRMPPHAPFPAGLHDPSTRTNFCWSDTRPVRSPCMDRLRAEAWRRRLY